MNRKNTRKSIFSKRAIEEIRERMRLVQSNRDRIHVISHENGWAVIREGARRADRVFKNKEEAIRRAESFLKKGTATELVIHKKDASIDRWEKVPKRTEKSSEGHESHGRNHAKQP